MYIHLDNIRSFHSGGDRFELPSNIVRFNEFENSIVFLLDENGKRDKIVGVKFSQKGGINHFYIDWEFQIIDGIGTIYKIDGAQKVKLMENELFYCRSGSFDIAYYLDPDTGKIVKQEIDR
jgi:hypothetical protein